MRARASGSCLLICMCSQSCNRAYNYTKFASAVKLNENHSCITKLLLLRYRTIPITADLTRFCLFMGFLLAIIGANAYARARRHTEVVNTFFREVTLEAIKTQYILDRTTASTHTDWLLSRVISTSLQMSADPKALSVEQRAFESPTRLDRINSYWLSASSALYIRAFANMSNRKSRPPE